MNQSSESADGAVDLSGRQLDDFQLLRSLGRGGMADVYLANQRSLGREVAIKVLKPQLARDDSYVKRFQLEARAIAALTHANIVQVYGVGCVDGLHYIAQEYVQGANLRQMVKANGPLDLRRATIIMRQVAAGLAAAGQRQIVHRDIKPDNIIITRQGEVKIADFGLARSPDSNQAQLTEVGITMGTPLYMSPEQVQGKSVDHRSDIFSFGATCYYMLSETVPFEGETPLSIAVKLMNEDAPPLSDHRPDLPPRLCELVHRMMARSRTERVQRADQIIAELKETTSGLAELDWSETSLPPLASNSPSSDLDSQITVRPPLVATQKLATVMQRRQGGTGWARWWSTVALLTAFGFGCTVAWMSRRAPLFAVSSTDEFVTRQETAEAQFIYAVMTNSEAAWKSVEHYFPIEESADNRRWCRRAQQNLARYYIENDQLQLAYEQFSQLAALGEDELEFRTFGFAGQAIIHALRDQPQQFREKAAAALPNREVLDAKMKSRLEQLARKFGAKTDRID